MTAQLCLCGRPIVEADIHKTPYGWVHADEESGYICEEGWYDEYARHWHDPLYAEPRSGGVR